MNLQSIANGAIVTVNPNIPALLKQSIGYTTNSAGQRTPNYAPEIAAKVQVQSVTQGDLRKLEGMNIQGVDTTVYLNGALSGTVRVLAKGGDLLHFKNQWWLVVAVLERWPNWAKLAVTMQNGS